MVVTGIYGSHICKAALIISLARACPESGVVVGIASQLDSTDVCPGEVCAEVCGSRFLSFNSGHDIGVSFERVVQLSIRHSLEGCDLRCIPGAVVAVKRQKVVCSSAKLLNREDIQAIRQGFLAEFLLPLREVDSDHRRHGILLLPLGEIIHVRFWVNSHHLCLETQDR